MKAPENKKELQVFLGGITFYDKFIKDRAKIAEPLYRLLDGKIIWEWGQSQKYAFETLKQKLASAPVLAHFDSEAPIIVSADASPIGMGGVLANKRNDGAEQPCVYISKTFDKTQRNYSQLDREALALVTAVKTFHQLIYGRHFTLITDHKPLINIFSKNKQIPDMISPKLKRYSMALAAYDYDLIYREGKQQNNVDMLSRMPLEEMVIEEDVDCQNIFMIEGVSRNPVDFEEIVKKTLNDSELQQIKRWVKTGWPVKIDDELRSYWNIRNEISIHKEALIWGDRIIVPRELRCDILKYLHGNHPGIVATKQFARSYVWWPKIDNQIENFVKDCNKCQETQRNPTRAPKNEWKTTEGPWQRIHIDFAGPFLGQTFLLVVDSFSKWLEVRRVPNMTSNVVVKEFRQMFATFGIPRCIVSDNDTAFKSAEMKDFLDKNGIKIIYIAPYHPSSNGQAERMVQTTKQALRKLTSGDWETKIARFLMRQHCVPISESRITPAELMFGRPLRTAMDVIRSKDDQEVGNDDSISIPRRLKIGEKVRMKNYRSSGPKWILATVTKKIGSRMYEVIEEHTGIHHRRHIDQIVTSLRNMDDYKNARES